MSIRIAILTVSDRSARGERPDASGPALVELASQQGWQVVAARVVPDNQLAIQEALLTWCDRGEVDLILTTGGTGFAPRDITPEATLSVIERSAPGLVEAMRQQSLTVTPYGMLSRAAAGIRGHTLIINLPGSPKAALENIRAVLEVLPHAVDLLRDSPSAEAGHNPL